jgi:RNA polymerase sigma-70 factor (sigma-E family)
MELPAPCRSYFKQTNKGEATDMQEADGFTDFVQTCSQRLYRVACLLTGGDLAGAEDLVADALARVYLAWPRIRQEDAFGYARRTLVNRHIDGRRRQRRRGETLTDQLPESAAFTNHDDDVARRDSVARSLRQLNPRERAVVVLRYFLDLSERDTAAELGLPIGTVKSANSRALSKLRVSPELVEPTLPAVPSHHATPHRTTRYHPKGEHDESR